MQLTLMPFLDILFATIGVFVVVFALQSKIESEAARKDSADMMIICTDPTDLMLYRAPDADPQSFRQPAKQLEALAAMALIRIGRP